MNRNGRSMGGGRMQPGVMLPKPTSYSRKMISQPSYGAMDSDLFCNLFTQPLTNFQSVRQGPSEPMECQLEYYQPQSMDTGYEDEMAEYSSSDNDYQQQQVETADFPSAQQSHYSKEQVMMLLARYQQIEMMNRGPAAPSNKSQFVGALQTAPIRHPQFNQGMRTPPKASLQKPGSMNKNQFHQPPKQQQSNNKRNNPAPKPMPNGRQQKQQKEVSRSLTQDRRVMPLLPPPRSESLKNKKATGANSNYGSSSNSYNNNKSVAKKNYSAKMPFPTGQKKTNKPTVAIKSPTQIKSLNDSGPLPPQPSIINGTRLMTGSVQMVTKWWHNLNSKQSKQPPPPLFETVGILVDSDKAKKHDSQQRFALRNRPQWHIEDYLGDVNSVSRPNDHELLQCYHYAIDDINMPPNGSIVRVMGVMPTSADGEFHCLKIRNALESELTMIEAKVEKWSVHYGESRHNQMDVDEEPSANQRSVTRYSYDAGYPEY